MAKLLVNIGKLFGKPFVNSKQFAKLFDLFFGCEVPAAPPSGRCAHTDAGIRFICEADTIDDTVTLHFVTHTPRGNF